MPPVIEMRRPRAPFIETSSSSGLAIAASAASTARRCSPEASPVPIIAPVQRLQITKKVMENIMKKALSLLALFLTLAIPSGLSAQQAGYSQTNLVSNTAGVGTTTDTQLANPWGISIFPGTRLLDRLR